MSNTTTNQVCYGTINSQPVKATIYYEFTRSTGKTPHDLVVLRSLHGFELNAMRDRTRTYLNRKLNNFSSTIVPVREDKLGRGCYYTAIPIYAGRLPNGIRSALIQHYNSLGMREWVNTNATPVAQPERGKDKVVKIVNPNTYTASQYLSFTEAMNQLLALDMVILTNIAKDNGIQTTNNKVVLCKSIAQQVKIKRPTTTTPVETEQEKGIRLLSELALLAMEPEELPAIPLAEQVIEAEVVKQQPRLLPNFNNMTVPQLRKLASANNIKLRKRVSKSELITILSETIG